MPKGTSTEWAPRATIDRPAASAAVGDPRVSPFVAGERAPRLGAVLTESVHIQRAVNGQQIGPDSGSNPRAHREHGGWDTPPTGAGSSEMAWKSTDTEDPLRDESILIIDDCTLYRENLAAIFALNGMATPSVAWDLPSLVTALHGTEPSVVLLNMETRGSALLLQAAMDLSPNMRVIVLGASEDNESEIVACAEAGVAGYHMRTDSLEDLLVLIHKVAAGETTFSPRVSAILLRRLSALASQRQPAAKELALTAREAQILRMLELGRSNQDIATQLRIAVHTVKNHVHSLLTKLGVSTRAEAAALSRTVRLHQG
jgi:DNA-binding NarL/FixJ family response regulator